MKTQVPQFEPSVLLNTVHRAVRRQRVQSSQAIGWQDIGKLICVHVLRHPLVGGHLPPTAKDQLRSEMPNLLNAYRGVPPSPEAIDQLARTTIAVAQALRPQPRHPGAKLRRYGKDGLSLQEMAEAAVYAECLGKKNEDDIVRSAVTRVWREKRKQRGHQKRLNIKDSESVRSMMALPSKGDVYLPRNDLRHAMMKNGHVAGLMRQASLFHEDRIRPVLGDDLWMLGKLCGFVDRHHHIVMVETDSSIAAQELQLQQTAYVNRLKQIPGFEKVRRMKISVKQRQALPVLPRTSLSRK